MAFNNSSQTEITVNNNSQPEIKIAIVGEGPVGQCLLANMLKYINDGLVSKDKCKIFFYKNRNSFERRHVVEISEKTVKKIENILNCNDCISKSDFKGTIRVLEQTLYDNILKLSALFTQETSFNKQNNESKEKKKHCMKNMIIFFLLMDI
jgi:threonine dehydrogenase-like Zn-dependent dehydrogenase